MLSLINRYTFTLLVVLTLAGCASGPTEQDSASADYGSVIHQDEAESQIKSYFNRSLKDPLSAQYTFSEVKKGYMIGNAFEGKPLYAGYVVMASVNAKNSYGGYTGAQSYHFLFQSGTLVRGLKVSPSGLVTPLF